MFEKGAGSERDSVQSVSSLAMNFPFRRHFSRCIVATIFPMLGIAMAIADKETQIFVGKSDKPEYLALKVSNRHGLVTGATGTGKTVTLQVLAEGFSRAGVPVFAADIKGDLSGIAACGEPRDFLVARARQIGVEYQPDEFPAMFWDVFGEQGHPIRATISEMGPLLLSRLMDLNDVQEGVLNIAFRIADEGGLLLIDLKDLRAVLGMVA